MSVIEIGGIELQRWVRTGEVLSSEKHSETHIRSQGGGGHVSSGSGYVAPARITSQSVEKHEIWVREEDGTEFPLQLSGVNLPLRAGQTISAVMVGRRNYDTGYIAAIVNHSANAVTRVHSDQDLANRLGLTPNPHTTEIVLVSAAVAAFGFFAIGNFLVMGAGLLLAGYGVRTGYRAMQTHPGRRATLARFVGDATRPVPSKAAASA